MTQPVTLPVWLFVLILAFAVLALATNFLFPSVRWFFRRRMERAVARLNTRLVRPIEPFKLLRRYDLIQRLCYHPDVTQAIVDYARSTGQREDVAFERAKRYAREIVPSFSAFTYFGWGVRVARLLSNAFYRVRLGHHDPKELAGIDPEATVIFVMNHRSNMDYVLVTHLAADRSALSYAVGEWAQVWPLSRLIRMMGAYFIRRRARDGLYRKVLRRYVQMATSGGSTQAIFPEGGLSLDGGLKPAKLGLLTYITEGLSEVERDVVFVPVGLNYDRVLEDNILIKADKAGNRRFGVSITHVFLASLKRLWLRVTGRYHRFGYAAVSFGKPLSMKDFPDLAQDPQKLADNLMERIAAIIPVLPVPLVARLLSDGPKTISELSEDMDRLLNKLENSHVHLCRDDKAYTLQVGLRALVKRGVVTAQSPYRITENGQDLARFYANSIRHLG